MRLSSLSLLIALLSLSSAISPSLQPANAQNNLRPQGLAAPTPVYGGGYGGGYGMYGGGGYNPYGGYGYNSINRPLGSLGNLSNPYPYYNNGYGYGNYGAPLVGGSPVIYGSPMAVPGVGGYFRIGKVGVNYWQSPSGYYYPWGVGAVGVPQQIYYVQQGATTQVKPPLPTELNDMEKYLEENKAKGRIADSDYQHLFRRLHDLRSKYDRLAGEWDGLLDPQEEEHLRRDIDQCASEISMRVRPAQAGTAAPPSTQSTKGY